MTFCLTVILVILFNILKLNARHFSELFSTWYYTHGYACYSFLVLPPGTWRTDHKSGISCIWLCAGLQWIRQSVQGAFPASLNIQQGADTRDNLNPDSVELWCAQLVYLIFIEARSAKKRNLGCGCLIGSAVELGDTFLWTSLRNKNQMRPKILANVWISCLDLQHTSKTNSKTKVKYFLVPSRKPKGTMTIKLNILFQLTFTHYKQCKGPVLKEHK